MKEGVIYDSHQIDKTFCALYDIAERWRRQIFNAHVGRLRDKKTGTIICGPDISVDPVIVCPERKLDIEIFVSEVSVSC